MHLPPHPMWFWLVLISPFVAWIALWIAANTLELSLKPIMPWLWAASGAFFVLYIVLNPWFGLDGSRRYGRLSFVSQLVAYTCYSMALWIKGRYSFECLRPPSTKWYLPWTAASFSMPTGTRILVRDIDLVTPWYMEKLGLWKLAENPRGETDIATLRFKKDGNSVVLTMREDFRTGRTPIFFTKKIGKMRDVMTARGVAVGSIERDRQGIQYFQIHDPEGNEIEVVQES
jgi:predicted enzyme related to lactoylglutathione lyase